MYLFWLRQALNSALQFPFEKKRNKSILLGCFQIKKLKGQLEGRQKNNKLDLLRAEDGILENGTDAHVMDLQSEY
jgi:hypothetical protein